MLTWGDVEKIIMAFVISIGGSSIVIISLSKWLSDLIAKGIEQKIRYSLDKDLEKYKGILGNKTYISRARFDTEFEALKELNDILFDVYITYTAFSTKINDSVINGNAQYFIDYYQRGQFVDSKNLHSLMEFHHALFKYSPFIDTTIKIKYEMIFAIFTNMNHYYDLYFEQIEETGAPHLELLVDTLNKVQQECLKLSSCLNELNEAVRKYMDGITVV